MKKLAMCTVLLAIVAGFSCQEIAINSISGVPEGRPGIDYPNLTEVPRKTTFFCRDRQPGFYADPSTRCQVWHWCDTFGIRHSFICPNMTVFNQQIRGCDWWYNVNCDLAISQYVNNEELYKPGPIFKRLKQNHARVEASSSDNGAFRVASHEDRLVTEEANAIHPTTRPVLHDSFFDITRPTFTPSVPTTSVLSTQGTIAPAPNVFNNNLGNQQPSVHFRPLRPFLRSFRPSTLSPIPDNSEKSVNIASLSTISQPPPPPPPPPPTPPQQTFSQSPPPPPPVPQQAVFIGFNRITPRPQNAQNSIQPTVFQRLPHQSFFRPSTPDHQIFQVSTTTQPTNFLPTQFQPAITPNQFNQPSTQFHSGSQQQFFHTTSQIPIPQPEQSQQTSFPQELSTTQPPTQLSQSSFPLKQFEQSRIPQPHFQQLSTPKPQFQQSNTRQPQTHQFNTPQQIHQFITPQPQFQQHSTPLPQFQQHSTPQPQFQQHNTPQPHLQQPSTPQQPAQQFSSPQPQFQQLSTIAQPQQQFHQFGTKQQFPVSRTSQVQFQTPNTSQQTFFKTSSPQPSSIVESTSPIHEQFQPTITQNTFQNQHNSAPVSTSTPPEQTFPPQAVTSPQPSPHQLVIQRASPQPILAQNLQRGNQPFFKPAFRFFTPSSPPSPPPPAPVTPQAGFTPQTSGVSVQSNGAPPSFISTHHASVTPDSQDLFSPEVTTAFESFGSKVTHVNNEVESERPSPGTVATTTTAPTTTIRPPLSLPPTPNSFAVESSPKIVSSTGRPTFPAFRTTTPPRPQSNENDADFDPFAHLPFGARLPALAKTRSNNEESHAGSSATHIEISARPPLQNDISNGRTRSTITTTTTARTTPTITTQRPRRASIITAPTKAVTVPTTPSATTSTAVVRTTNKPILIARKRRINRNRTSSTFPVTTYKPTNTFIPTTAEEFQSSTLVSDSDLVNFGDVIANGDDSSNLEGAQTSIGNIAIN